MSKWRGLVPCGTVLFSLTLLATSASAELANAPFSAEMIRRGPDGTVSDGRLYVGKDRMRVEMSQQGQTMVRIIDEPRRTEWVLFPEQRGYVEHPAPPTSEFLGAGPDGDESPCAGMPGLTCRQLGQEMVQGRRATKWEITGSRQGQTFTMKQWIDDERGVPLIQEFPNGQTNRLALVGEEKVDGRGVEKWEMVATAPNQPERRAFQWYDPQLKLVIKQELPGGIVTELKNIEVGHQPDELFLVPQDYTRMRSPEGMASPPAGAGR